MNARFINIIFIMIILFGCKTTLPVNVEYNPDIKFAPSKKIYIETDEEIVKLSSRLKMELKKFGFSIVSSKKKAGYILSFHYNAKYDVYPWIFHSFSLTLSNPESGEIIYQMASAGPGSEPVDSVMNKTVSDMAAKLLNKGRISLIITDNAKK